MPTTCQEKNEEKYLTGWGAAIADARRRIADLQLSLRVFERQKREGRPWPGDLLDRPRTLRHGRSANQQHAIRTASPYRRP
jgi:hypothetical protein